MVVITRSIQTATASALLLALSIGVHAQKNDPGTPYAITGLTTDIDETAGKVPARLEINDLQSKGALWDLYILGLAAFQKEDEDNMLSYFQISGIHGRPFIPWNGVNAVRGGSGGGYCPHNDVQFASWHRPYVALYEQVLASHIQAIASEYSGDDAAVYQSAADTWRTPYWDWAMNPTLPPAASSKTITVNAPAGPTTIPNPLYSYKWQNSPLDSSSNYFPQSGDKNCWFWSETTRQPDSAGNSQLNIVDSKLGNDGANLRNSVYRTLTMVKDFNTMAGNSGSSLENPHNDVHNTMYCIMAYLDYAGFDPIFWLHHANVDRLVAMFQAINYNSTYQAQTTSSPGLYSTARNTPITADSPLKPFYKDNQGNFHTGKSVAEIKTFGYTYPEIDYWSSTREETRKNVIASVNCLYGSGSGAGSKSCSATNDSGSGSTGSTQPKATTSVQPTSTKPGKGSTPAAIAPAQASPTSKIPGNPPQGNNNKNPWKNPFPVFGGQSGNRFPWSSGRVSSPRHRRHEEFSTSPSKHPLYTKRTTAKTHYFVDVQVERAELPLPCNIDVYLGDKWQGAMSLPSMPPAGVSFSEVPINSAEDIGPPVSNSTTGLGMIGVIQGKLKIRIRKADNTEVPAASVPSLRIQVKSQEVTPPASLTELPVYGEFRRGPPLSVDAPASAAKAKPHDCEAQRSR